MFIDRLTEFLEPLPHPHKTELTRILAAKTSVSTSGYPYISPHSFTLFLKEVPHLFAEGRDLLNWLNRVEQQLSTQNAFQPKEQQSLRRSIFVLRNVVHTAAICAPPDLWILKHILSAHAKVGLTSVFLESGYYDLDELSDRFDLDRKHLSWDLSFLFARGYLRCRGSRYSLEETFQAADVFQKAEVLPQEFLIDFVEPIARVILGKGSAAETEIVRRFFDYPERDQAARGWQANHFQINIGFRLVPTVLALHFLRWTDRTGAQRVSDLPPFLLKVLADAGIVEDGNITMLGNRIFSRGPGPFGIIHAYVPYMRELENKLRGKKLRTHVQRTKNIAASQAANRKTFLMGNDSLDRFCQEQNFRFRVFIEHALGQGEAIRQRWERSGEQEVQYFGADLEDAAIDAASTLQQQGMLPKNMIFIRNADIANPDVVISAVQKNSFQTRDAVMFVGNGFHEIRGQTNARIVEVFKKYCEAGFLVIFTEESALDDRDLLATGWNTYHTGFRYVHELSGQGLRPAAGVDRDGRFSWKICAALGGYAVLPKYSVHTRTIYPYPRKGGYNPPISMTYFCVPESLARRLGFYPVNWSQIPQNS